MDKFEKLLDTLMATPMADEDRIKLQVQAVSCRSEFLYEQKKALQNSTRADTLDTVVEQLFEKVCNRIGND